MVDVAEIFGGESVTQVAELLEASIQTMDNNGV